MSEDDKTYKILAELTGLDAKDVEVSVPGNRLVLKGEKRQEKEEKDKNYYFPSTPMAPSNEPSTCPTA